MESATSKSPFASQALVILLTMRSAQAFKLSAGSVLQFMFIVWAVFAE